ncbi:FadD3 family acyl-CoA ligase [Candidatus Poriferisocius sp.]|uniref:FadD3 family acyl-CoA ligase n=1 Tax=Candidatus Poriferisocius sp. TaxID=3101276 RepID=UPI003B522472
MSEGSWNTICELVDDAARRFPDLEALVDGDVRWTFPELRDRIRASARALMASGIEPGDRVAVWAPNIWEWVVAGLGIHLAGGVLVPVNTRFKGREADFILQKSRARILFTVTDFLDNDYVALLRDADGGQCLDEIVVLRGTVPDGTTGFAEFLERADQVVEADGDARSAAVSGDDLCHIMFTSGTTGLPKGAMLIHSAICRGFKSWCEVIGLRAGDRYLIINPFFHAFGLNSGILACLMTGATNIPHPVFDVPAVMARVPEESISMLPGPPAIYQTILNHPELDSFDMSTLRLAVTGAAAIPVEMILQMRARLGFETIVTGYGLTEASGIATMCRHDDDPETIANTSGRAIPNVEVQITDDDGNELPRGEPGEIVVRGYNVMRGYLDDPTQTAETIDANGWLHTGDIGVMDANGNIDITDRKKDMFIVGGFNAYPAEIENIMLAHPEIGQVAVIGMPDDRLGEVAVANVVPVPGADPSDAEIIGWCRDQMANYKVPRRVRFTDALPLNASGKVLKYVLREQAAAE